LNSPRREKRPILNNWRPSVHLPRHKSDENGDRCGSDGGNNAQKEEGEVDPDVAKKRGLNNEEDVKMDESVVNKEETSSPCDHSVQNTPIDGVYSSFGLNLAELWRNEISVNEAYMTRLISDCDVVAAENEWEDGRRWRLLIEEEAMMATNAARTALGKSEARKEDSKDEVADFLFQPPPLDDAILGLN